MGLYQFVKAATTSRVRFAVGRGLQGHVACGVVTAFSGLGGERPKGRKRFGYKLVVYMYVWFPRTVEFRFFYFYMEDLTSSR